jgi:choice-of-anchor C domain-containing protein
MQIGAGGRKDGGVAGGAGAARHREGLLEPLGSPTQHKRVESMARFLSCVILLAFAATTSGAEFQNGSFEYGSVPNTCNVYDLPAGSNVITGWTVSVGTIDWEGPPPCGWRTLKGNNSIDLVGKFCVGGIQQTFDTTPGSHYRLSFLLAGNYGAPPVIKPLAVTVNGVTTNFLFDTTGKSQFNMGWVRKNINFVASGSSSTVSFVSDVSASGPPCDAGAVIDHVTVRARLVSP